MRLIEEWKKGLDSGLLVGAILMDLSKAFDCIPHDLLIAKLKAYGFQNSALLYIYSHLKGRKLSVRINNTYSSFLTILSGIPQGSILGPILFNIFINDLFMFIRDAHLHSFAGDHTLSAAKKNLEDLKIIFNKESEKAIKWLNKNEMIVNPSKFQAIVLAKSRETISTTFHINDKEIESKDSIKLLGITIDDKLNFNSHISKLCNRASRQLNTLFRFNNYLTPQTKKLAVDSFLFSNFNYCPLICNFSTAKSISKVEKVQERALKFLYDEHALSYPELLEKGGKHKMSI